MSRAGRLLAASAIVAAPAIDVLDQTGPDRRCRWGHSPSSSPSPSSRSPPRARPVRARAKRAQCLPPRAPRRSTPRRPPSGRGHPPTRRRAPRPEGRPPLGAVVHVHLGRLLRGRRRADRAAPFDRDRHGRAPPGHRHAADATTPPRRRSRSSNGQCSTAPDGLTAAPGPSDLDAMVDDGSTAHGAVVLFQRIPHGCREASLTVRIGREAGSWSEGKCLCRSVSETSCPERREGW